MSVAVAVVAHHPHQRNGICLNWNSQTAKENQSILRMWWKVVMYCTYSQWFVQRQSTNIRIGVFETTRGRLLFIEIVIGHL